MIGKQPFHVSSMKYLVVLTQLVEKSRFGGKQEFEGLKFCFCVFENQGLLLKLYWGSCFLGGYSNKKVSPPTQNWRLQKRNSELKTSHILLKCLIFYICFHPWCHSLSCSSVLVPFLAKHLNLLKLENIQKKKSSLISLPNCIQLSCI